MSLAGTLGLDRRAAGLGVAVPAWAWRAEPDLDSRGAPRGARWPGNWGGIPGGTPLGLLGIPTPAHAIGGCVIGGSPRLA